MLIPWVPEVFPARGGKFWCWPKVDISRPQAEATIGEAARLSRETCLRETENRARKFSGQGKMLCFSTIFAETICTKQSKNPITVTQPMNLHIHTVVYVASSVTIFLNKDEDQQKQDNISSK